MGRRTQIASLGSQPTTGSHSGLKILLAPEQFGSDIIGPKRLLSPHQCCVNQEFEQCRPRKQRCLRLSVSRRRALCDAAAGCNDPVPVPPPQSMTPADDPKPLPRWAALSIAAALACGIVLRLIWHEDMEYKLDERWLFEHARALLDGGPWPWIGIASSMGPPNPGLSLWVFAGLGFAFGADSPPELARAVQLLNCAALIALVLFATTRRTGEMRERWLWAAALWAANPLALIFERKIWPPSVLPLAAIALIAAWWYRRQWIAGFLCAMIAALMAQIHLGVTFLAAALFGWGALHDLKERVPVRWSAWLAGGALGSLPALPWLMALIHGGGGQPSTFAFAVPKLHFFLRWVLQPFGYSVDYTLGRADFLKFLANPTVLGQPTYAMAALHVVLLLIMVVTLIRAARFLVAARPSPWAFFIGSDQVSVLISAVLWGYGGLLTLLTVFGPDSHRHYMIFIAPVMALWCTRQVIRAQGTELGNRARAALTVLWVCQAAVGAGLLAYIHQVQIIPAEYGATWRSQQPGAVGAEPIATPGGSTR